MTRICFEIPGKVKAKQSFKIGRNGFKYTPTEIKEYANWVRICFKEAYPKHLPSVFYNQQLNVVINAFFSIPKSFSKTKRQQALEAYIRPTIKPDCDNIAKNINDALNGIAYPDDKQIIRLEVNKHYGEAEKVEVIIYD